MESTDSSTTGSQQHQHHQPNLPPGFRFHPTDEELVIHYLKKKATSAPLPVAIIAEVDLYKFDPWELPAKATFGEQEWYFFSPRDRKYPNGARPNRAATSGYWKATGTDKPVLASGGTQKVGVKKALVFYGGKPPKGIKTNWIMHEYRLAETKVCNKPPGFDLGKKNSLRLDDWVLCRIYKKNNAHRSMDPEREDSMDDMMGPIPQSISMGPGLHHQHQLQHHHHHHQNLKFQLPKAATRTATAAATSSSFGALIENDHNFFEGMLNNDSTMSQQFVSSSTTSTQPPPPELNPNNNNSIISPTNNTFSLKRTLPPGLYWNDVDEDEAGPSTSKRLQFDNTTDGNNAVLRSSTTTTTTTTTTDGNGNGNGNGPTSIAALLGQLPQTPPLHQQAMLGSLGDGLFRAPPYQLPGMNWYS